MQKRGRQPVVFDYRAEAWSYSREALFWADVETGHILDANPQAQRLLGRTRKQLLGLCHWDLHPSEQRDLARAGFASHAEGLTTPTQLDIERGDGRRVPVEIRAQIVDLSGRRMLLGAFRDLTEWRAERFETRRRAAALGAIHQATVAAMEASTGRDLMEAICHGIIAEGEYAAAFVGFANDDAERTITIAAASGRSRGYLEEVPLVWADTPGGQGATGRAIRLGTTQIVNRSQEDPVLAPWAARMRRFGVAAMLSVPLFEGANPIGALTIYAREPDVFGDVEQRLFEDLGRQLVLGIRVRRERTAYAEQVVENVRREAQVRRALEQTVGAVSATIEQRDPYTAGHSRTVGELSERIGKRLGIASDRSHGIYLAGLVHDVGKIRIPSELLSMPRALSAIEYELLKTHAEVGHEILRDVEFPWPIAEATYQHHERLDGSGYPRGLRGDEVILEARIIAVADIIDSMCAHRPYRAALGMERAVSELRRMRGALLDAEVVDAALLEVG